MVYTEIPRSTQCTMEVFSDSLELVDFVIGLVNSVLKRSFPENLHYFTLELEDN